jgi:hypothetical protein
MNRYSLVALDRMRSTCMIAARYCKKRWTTDNVFLELVKAVAKPKS